nr:hypothetical protein CFP56_47281 [Quercus suber]
MEQLQGALTELEAYFSLSVDAALLDEATLLRFIQASELLVRKPGFLGEVKCYLLRHYLKRPQGLDKELKMVGKLCTLVVNWGLMASESSYVRKCKIMSELVEEAVEEEAMLTVSKEIEEKMLESMGEQSRKDQFMVTDKLQSFEDEGEPEQKPNPEYANAVVTEDGNI